MKAVIFDLDGVICFTDEYHYMAWKEIADKIGIDFDREKNNRLRGVSRMESLDIILESSEKEYTMEEKEKLAEEKNAIYVKLLNNMTPNDLPEDVRVTLQELRQGGYKLAIGSSSKNTKMILRKIGLEDFFDAVSDGTNITHSKPDPEVFLKAAEMINEKPSECLVVEDAMSGAEAANRGGFPCAGIGEAAHYPKITYQLKNISDIISQLTSL